MYYYASAQWRATIQIFFSLLARQKYELTQSISQMQGPYKVSQSVVDSDSPMILRLVVETQSVSVHV